MALNGVLIHCPDCSAGKPMYLGRVDKEYRFIFRRYHSFEVIVESREYKIHCQCGRLVFQRTEGGTAYV